MRKILIAVLAVLFLGTIVVPAIAHQRPEYNHYYQTPNPWGYGFRLGWNFPRHYYAPRYQYPRYYEPYYSYYPRYVTVWVPGYHIYDRWGWHHFPGHYEQRRVQ